MRRAASTFGLGLARVRHTSTANPAPLPEANGDASTATAEGTPARRKTMRPTVVPPSPEAQAAFLDSFRAKLAAADASGDGDGDLGKFLRGGAEPMRESSYAAIVPPVRDPTTGERTRLPPWLKLQIPKGPSAQPKYNAIRKSLRAKKLATVCEEARCPNIGECWGGTEEVVDGVAVPGTGIATATIMVMGDTCTRGCRFCAIKTSRAPPPLDPDEPEHVADAVATMGVDYIVVTMVDRDDMPDGGAGHVAKAMAAIKRRGQEEYERKLREAEASGASTAEMRPLLLEVLAGDFRGVPEQAEAVARAGVDVYAHNIECVERVTPNVRDRRANYRQSLAMLAHVKKALPHVTTKSSIMLGVGETEQEVLQTLKDLREAGCDAVTLGQYLQPASTRMKVSRYVHPLEFDEWKRVAEKDLGFAYCASGPMVRSSYKAGEYYLRHVVDKQRAANAKGE